MTLLDSLGRTLDPLYGRPRNTRQAFVRWYRQARLPQIRYVAFLTMALYLVYALIEQSLVNDQQGWRLLAHALLVPLALLAVGLLSFRERWHGTMRLMLCAAPIGAVLANLLFNTGNEAFAYFAPEIYLCLIWIFAISGLSLRLATLTGGIATLALLMFTLDDAMQPGPQRLHLLWVLASLSFGLLCAFLLEVAYKTMFLHQDRLLLSASLDGLTGLLNRTRIDQCLGEELARARRYGTDFSLIMIDLDHFKEVNDLHGHGVGDSVLRQFSALLRDSVRSVDQVGRLGGEEFLILLPEVGLQQAQAAARSLQQRIRACEFERAGRQTASFGVAQFQQDADPQALLERADRALYRAKASGRDRIESE